MTFKLHTEWSKSQCVSAPIIKILSDIMVTYKGLNSFAFWQTNVYQNIAKPLLNLVCIIIMLILGMFTGVASRLNSTRKTEAIRLSLTDYILRRKLNVYR